MILCRTNRCRTYLLAALAVNVLVLLYLAFIQHSQTDNGRINKSVNPDLEDVGAVNTLPKDYEDVTIVIREFEEFENEIFNTVMNINQMFKKIPVVVVGDEYPYPPLQHSKNPEETFHFVPLKNYMWQDLMSSRPESFLKTKYVMVMPDAAAAQDSQIFKTLVKMITEENSTTVLAVPIQNTNTFCSQIIYDFKKWTLEFLAGRETVTKCNNAVGDHAVFMRTSTLLQLSQPYLRPTPLSLYIQGSLKQWTVRVVDRVGLTWFKVLYQSDPHNRWKHKHNQEERLTQMYKHLGIKLVIHGNGRRLWYGCSKNTERCFDTVVDDMPEYLYEKRWTPPCCLKALRETSKHVFSILDMCEARYWLEGGSLLGAARNGDIIPWDYDVDVGIYLEDVNKCDYLRQCSHGSYEDESGYVWEKAREGDFYRVQYSESNRLHVDIFPFFPKNGTMTKNTWIKTHRQDTEFPEHFLKPLSKIKFVGLEVKAPNNVKEFLEFKFGPGVLENPKYPNAEDPV